MPDIRPVSDLRNHFKDIEADVKKSGGPIFFTQKGRAAFVLLSNEKYDELSGGQAPTEPLVDKDTLKQYGKVLTNLRICNQMTPADVAVQLSWPVARVEELERGEAVPGEREAAALCKLYGIKESTLDFFLDNAHDKDSFWFRKVMAEILEKIASV